MHYPLVIIWESGKWLRDLLGPICLEHGWSLREARDLESCLGLVPRRGPALLVFEVRSTEGRELLDLDRLRSERAGVDVFAVLPAADAELAGLCWDLGAAYVSEKRHADELPAVLIAWMRRRWPPSRTGAHGTTATAGSG